jgi:glycerophosphoryl diester phosphodiesterase
MSMLLGIMRTQILGLLALTSASALAACGSLSIPGASAGGSGGWPYPSIGHVRPLIIAHRGASGALPEHTLEAYHRALNDGADCIEPDLVMSKDGVLVDRHDTFLSTTTNIASHPEFAARKRKSPDPEFSNRDDWWVADFTLAELKTLRAIQPMKGRSKAYDNLYPITTFDEDLDLVASHHKLSGEPACIYPEAKSPAYHASLGLPDMATAMLATLAKHGMDKKGSPVFIQSFEPEFVKKIQPMTELPVIMLVADRKALDAAMAIPGAPFWDGLGPTYQMLYDPATGKSTGIVEQAHAKGIKVHPWTFRDDQPVGEEPIETTMKKVLATGVDGFFTDFSNTGYRVVNAVQLGAAAE